MRRFWLFGVSSAVLALAAFPAPAQTVIGAKSGVINWVEGDVFLNDKPYVAQPSQFGEVKENMVLRTEEGRAEVLLPPGVFFRMAENSSFKMISNRLIDTRVELLTGAAIIEIDDLAKEATVTLVDKDGTVTLTKAGIYRFDAQPAQIKVYKGSAEVAIAGQNVSVSAGKMLLLSGGVAAAEKFNIEDTDSLDHWSRRRGELLANANISAAKQAGGYGSYGGGGYYGGMNPCYGYGTYGGFGTGPFIRPWGTWGYNPYYGLGTYIPCQGSLMSPYGYRYWSPYAVYQAFFAPRPAYNWNQGGGGFGHSYPTMGSSMGGYSGSMGAASAGSYGGGSASAGAAMGGSSAGAGGAGGAGHGGGGGGGAAGGGGHGK